MSRGLLREWIVANGRLDGREILWCWKYGEDRIAHWHDLEAGFAGRQPLPEVLSRT